MFLAERFVLAEEVLGGIRPIYFRRKEGDPTKIYRACCQSANYNGGIILEAYGVGIYIFDIVKDHNVYWSFSREELERAPFPKRNREKNNEKI